MRIRADIQVVIVCQTVVCVVNGGKGGATFDCERTTWIIIKIIGIAIYLDTDTPVIVGSYLCAGMQKSSARNGKTGAVPVVKIPLIFGIVSVKRTILESGDF